MDGSTTGTILDVDQPTDNQGPLAPADGSAPAVAAAAPAPQPEETPATGSVPQNQPSGPSAPTQTPDQVTVSPTGQVTQPNIMQRAYHGILAALGGSNDVQLARDPQTGKMVATTVAKTPGSQWKQIIAGAVTGIAGAAGAGTGPGSKTRALAMGVGAGEQMAAQQQQSKVQQANQDYDSQQQALVRKAQLQQMAVQTAAASFSAERAKVDASDMDAKTYDEFHRFVNDNGGTDLGVFKDMNAVGDQAKSDPTLAADIAHGRVLVTPAVENTTDGQGVAQSRVVGIHVARVPEQWGNQMNTEDLTLPRQVPGKDGKPPTWENETIPAGTIKNSDYAAAMASVVTQQAKTVGDAAEVSLKQAETRTQGAEQQKDRAEAANEYAEAQKNRAEAKQLNEAADATSIAGNGKNLVEGFMDPSNLSKRSKSYDANIAAANAYSMQTYGVPWDIAKATSDYKYATNIGTQNTLKFLNSLTGQNNDGGNLGTVQQLAKTVGNGQFPALNDLSQWAKLESGNSNVVAYHAAIVETADQVAKILQGGGTGGGTSDAKLAQAQELFNKGFNASQINAVANTLRSQLGNRKTEMIGNNRYLLRWAGPQAAAPGTTPPANATAPAAATRATPPPTGASSEVYAADGKTLIGHVVNGQYQALGK